MKISVTNKRELVSARNHLYSAREMISRVKSKTEKRKQLSERLDNLYSLAWKANDEMLKLLDEVEETIGGK